MAMTEQEYIALVNRVRVSAALESIRDILPDDDAVPDAEHKQVVVTLRNWEKKLFKKTRIGDDDEEDEDDE